MKFTTLEPSKKNLKKVAELLKNDAVVAIPTETVYGLAGNAFSTKAVLKIFSAKERPKFDPLIVHVSKNLLKEKNLLKALDSFGIISISKIKNADRALIEKLLRQYWPGPLTVTLPKSKKIPDLVTSGLPNVAVRMPQHDVTQGLLDKLDFPLAAPSANRFGRISPTSAKHVEKELSGRIWGVLDGGDCEIGLESTVLGFDNSSSSFFLLRPGAITQKNIRSSLGKKAVRKPRASDTQLKAPGMLASHYAPQKKITLLPKPFSQFTKAELEKIFSRLQQPFGLLLMKKPTKRLESLLKNQRSKCLIEVLSKNENAAEISKNLFSKMRRLDESQALELIAEPTEKTGGLFTAISDRLTRASSRNT